MPKNELRRILLEAVEEGLASLGNSPKQAIFFHLENSFRIQKDKIPANLTGFAKALETIFGPGAPHIEGLIVKRLYEKLGLEFEVAEDRRFMEYIEQAKKHMSVKAGGQ